MANNVAITFGLTIFAGLSTGIGSAMAFFAKRTNTMFLSTSLGFSAGVMIYVSLIEIFAKAKADLIAELGTVKGYWLTVASFFAGIFVIAIIDKLIPAVDNPHEFREVEKLQDTAAADEYHSLYRMGLFTALAIAIHNFPEGIAVSVPVYYATGSGKIRQTSLLCIRFYRRDDCNGSKSIIVCVDKK